jgi:hypothetical protein
MGTFLATVVVFLLFVVISQSAGYYRSRLRVAGAEGEAGHDGRVSAAVGIGSGLMVLSLLVVLFLGFTRWHWFGSPSPPTTTPSHATPTSNQGVAPIGVSPTASPLHVPSPTH